MASILARGTKVAAGLLPGQVRCLAFSRPSNVCQAFRLRLATLELAVAAAAVASAGVDQQSDRFGRVGITSCSKPKRFGAIFSRLGVGDPGEVAAWTIEACYETEFNRVGTDHKDDRNDSRRRLGRQCRRAARCSDDVCDLASDSSVASGRKSIIVIFRPAIFDRNVAVLDVAGLHRPRLKSRRTPPPIFQAISRHQRNPTTGTFGCCARTARGHAYYRSRAERSDTNCRLPMSAAIRPAPNGMSCLPTKRERVSRPHRRFCG